MATSTNKKSTAGIQVPIQASGAGGFRLVRGDDFVKQLIQTLCGDCESSNPFQNEGIAMDAVFANGSDTAWKGKARRDIESLFKNVMLKQNLAKLISVSFKEGDVEGEYNMDIKYLSIESATEAQVVVPVRKG